MEKIHVTAARADESLLLAVSYLHEAGRIFGEWDDRMRGCGPFRDSYIEEILRIYDAIDSAENDVAYLLGMKVSSDLDAGRKIAPRDGSGE